MSCGISPFCDEVSEYSYNTEANTPPFIIIRSYSKKYFPPPQGLFMKHVVLATVFSLVSLTLATTATAQVSRSGTVKDMTGVVNVVRAQNTVAIAIGDAIEAGDRIETAGQSSLSFSMVDGTRMVMGANSKTTIEAFQFDGTSQEGSLLVRVYQGTLRMITGLIAKNNPNAVSVLTPTSVVGIRGTDFIVEVPGH